MSYASRSFRVVLSALAGSLAACSGTIGGLNAGASYGATDAAVAPDGSPPVKTDPVPMPPPSPCGNGTCDSGESCESCPADCASQCPVKPPPGPCVDCISMRVGRPRVIFGPVGGPADSPVVTFNDGSQVVGYTANSRTEVMLGANAGALNRIVGSSAIDRGSPGSFDECGAWIQAVESEPGLVRGFYHAERSCNYDLFQTDKSVAYSESRDGGRTFDKTANNRILTGTNTATVGRTTGSGDTSVVRWHDYLYMYYIDWNDPYGTGVARASLASGGTPGSWFKYFNGGFTEPGVGGRNTLLGVLGSNASHFTALDIIVLPLTDPEVGGDPDIHGVRLNVSTDGLHFTYLKAPLIVSDEDWSRTATSRELVSYHSIQAPEGGNHWSNAFDFFYVLVPPGEGFGSRYQVVRRVDVAVNAAPVNPQVQVALTRYFDQGAKDHWVTTQAPTGGAHVAEFDVGYLATRNTGGMVPLLDCYIPDWNDHMVGVGSCGDGAVLLRTLGFAYSPNLPQPAGTVPLYRCFLPGWTDHWVSNSDCTEGNPASQVKHEFLLGYAIAP